MRIVRGTLVGMVMLVAMTTGGCKKGGADDKAAVLWKEAGKLAAGEKYDEAADKLNVLISECPETSRAKEAPAVIVKFQAKAKFVQARTLAREGRFEEAGELLTEALALAPEDVEVNYGVGWVYIQTALEYATKAQMLRGGAGVADMVLLSNAHAELAKIRFERCLQLDPKHWAGHRGMAIYYLLNAQFDKALASADAADKLSTKPEDKIAVGRLRFQIYASQRKTAEGKKVIDDLLVKYPDSGEVYLSLAEYYLRQEKPAIDEAVKALETGVTKDVNETGTRNQMYLLLSQLKLRAGDYTGARIAIETALLTDPFNETLTDQYTVALEADKAAATKP